MDKAALIFREASLRERCAISLDIKELKILASDRSGETGEPDYVVTATGSIEPDRGFMHLRRASSERRCIPAFLTGVLDKHSVVLAGRYEIELSQVARDASTWLIRMASKPGARVLPRIGMSAGVDGLRAGGSQRQLSNRSS